MSVPGRSVEELLRDTVETLHLGGQVSCWLAEDTGVIPSPHLYRALARNFWDVATALETLRHALPGEVMTRDFDDASPVVPRDVGDTQEARETP